jgi:hypothetical protein
MRISNVFSGRPAYYDRGPTDINIGTAVAATGPHSATSRGSYTVPTARKAQVTGLSLVAERVTVAGTPSVFNAYCTQGGNVNQVASEQILNTVGAKAEVHTGATFTALAGDILQLFTSDGSLTGTCGYDVRLQAIEFDT